MKVYLTFWQVTVCLIKVYPFCLGTKEFVRIGVSPWPINSFHVTRLGFVDSYKPIHKNEIIELKY